MRSGNTHVHTHTHTHTHTNTQTHTHAHTHTHTHTHTRTQHNTESLIVEIYMARTRDTFLTVFKTRLTIIYRCAQRVFLSLVGSDTPAITPRKIQVNESRVPSH
jgi:hypothetical protein